MRAHTARRDAAWTGALIGFIAGIGFTVLVCIGALLNQPGLY